MSIPAFRTSDRSRRALFVTYGASHIAKVAPVVRVLERYGVECLVIALTTGYKKAQQLGLSPFGYQDFLHLVADPDAVIQRGMLLLEHNSHPDVGEFETCCYLGVNYNEWVANLGEEGAALMYSTKGRRSFMPLRFMVAVVKDLQPGVVVATGTPRSEQAAIEAAINLNIPTLTMADLAAPLPADPFLLRLRHADVVTVMSEEVRTSFLNYGLPASKVVTTGSPDFDALFEPSVAQAGNEFKTRMGWDGFRVVLWAGILEKQGGESLPMFAGSGLALEVERRLRQWVKSEPRSALIVRYHPNEYHAFTKLESQDRVYVSDPASEVLHPLLHASDIVIVQVSTVGLEASMLGKRVLSLGFSGWPQAYNFDLSSFGSSEVVPNLESLISVILKSKETSESIRRVNFPIGAAAPKVARQVLRLLRFQDVIKQV